MVLENATSEQFDEASEKAALVREACIAAASRALGGPDDYPGISAALNDVEAGGVQAIDAVLRGWMHTWEHGCIQLVPRISLPDALALTGPLIFAEDQREEHEAAVLVRRLLLARSCGDAESFTALVQSVMDRGTELRDDVVRVLLLMIKCAWYELPAASTTTLKPGTAS